MFAFQTTAQVRAFARLVLAWFVLSLGLAIAAPIVQPQSLTLVCSAAGEVKLQSTGSDSGNVAPTGHTLDCVLCLALSAPPPANADLSAPLPVAALGQAIQTAARNAWRTAAPLPARGPPACAVSI